MIAQILAAAALAAPAQSQAAAVKLPLPKIKDAPEKPPYPVVRLAAAGPYLLAVRKGAGYPYGYVVLDTAQNRVIWEARDACCGGPPPWDVLLSPTGTGVAVRYPDGQPQTPYKLLRGQGEPLPLPSFSGGAWAADGSWLGGPRAAYGADGQLLRPGVPDPKSAPEPLFAPGPGGALVRYVDLKRGALVSWSAAGEPRVEGPWRCAALAASRSLDGSAPVRLSPGGRYVAWSSRGGRPMICDGQTGKEVPLPEETASLAWGREGELFSVYEGEISRLALPQGERRQVALPRGCKEPTSVAATDTHLYIGTAAGEVFRLPRP